MSVGPQFPPSAQLCLSCGLCCSGALFPNAEFDESENPAEWEPAGFDVEEADGEFSFTLGCVHLDGARCTIYSEPRPYTCGGFQCEPLRLMEDEGLPLSSAMSTIKEAVRLSQIVSDAADAADCGNLRNYEAMRHQLDTAFDQCDDSGQKAAIGKARLALGVFDRFVYDELYPEHVKKAME